MHGSRPGESHAFFAAMVHFGVIMRRKRESDETFRSEGAEDCCLGAAQENSVAARASERNAGFVSRCSFQIESDGETRRGAWQVVRLATEPKFVKDGNLFVVRAIRAWCAVQGWCAICS